MRPVFVLILCRGEIGNDVVTNKTVREIFCVCVSVRVLWCLALFLVIFVLFVLCLGFSVCMFRVCFFVCEVCFFVCVCVFCGVSG